MQRRVWRPGVARADNAAASNVAQLLGAYPKVVGVLLDLVEGYVLEDSPTEVAWPQLSQLLACAGHQPV